MTQQRDEGARATREGRTDSEGADALDARRYRLLRRLMATDETAAHFLSRASAECIDLYLDSYMASLAKAGAA